MRTSESTANIAPALNLFLAGLHNPPKSEEVTAGRVRYSFAPLPDILDQVRPDLGKCGLALTVEGVNDADMVGSRALLIHTSGEWIEYGPLMLPAGTTAQTFGSALTYSRRYLVCAILNIAADEDDDGAKASRATKNKRQDWGEKTDPRESGGSEYDSNPPDRPGITGADPRVDPGAAPAATASGSAPTTLLSSLERAYGTGAAALVAARKAYSVTTLGALTAEQATALIEEAP